MYPWTVWIAVLIGPLWYFSEYGQTATQCVLCVVCCCLSTPLLLWKTIGQESGTQTDDEVAEAEAALQTLCKEFDLIVDRFICGARDFDLCEVMVRSVHILTQHLHNAKQTDRDPLFGSRAEEMAVLRVFSEALVRNLFPESLTGLDVNRCALNEIVALKGLELLVVWLSNPDNLNQLVVTKKLKEGWNKFVDKVKYKKRKRKSKKKKMKMIEQELIQRAMAQQGPTSPEKTVCSREDSSFRSLPVSDTEPAGLEQYMASVQEDMMEFKLSYEMWRVGHWTVTIPHDATRLPYITDLEPYSQQDTSAELRQEVRASVEIYLQELVRDEMIGHTQPVFQFLCPLDKLLHEEENVGGVWSLLSGLASILTPGQEEEEHNSLSVDVHAKVPSSPEPKAKASRGAVSRRNGIIHEHILAAMDSDSHSENSDSDSVPNNTEDGGEGSSNPLTSQLKLIMKGLSLSKLQESLVPTREADEEVEVPPHSNHSGAPPEDSESPLMWRLGGGKYGKREKMGLKLSSGFSWPKVKEEGVQTREDNAQGQRGQAPRENLEATKAIFDLLKEISGNSILLNIFDAILMPVMPILKKKVNTFLSKMNPTEFQMASYIDNMCGKLWPAEAAAWPKAPRTAEEKQETRDRAHHLINAKYSNYLILKKTDVENVFKLFQDGEENKKLVYMLLSFLLKEFLPHEDALSVSAVYLQRVNDNSSSSSN
ncbi:hypothetical protein CRUP_023195 [Coryphaenoides rupestris]|nr:hypothetical protein CRUP_023195 [Coryphaenoides rupestris]